ncbi:MAG: ABC transporter permease [Planctomycetota bacterium]|jgi:ABC-type antimicrobial peptide transport system permease subunit
MKRRLLLTLTLSLFAAAGAAGASDFSEKGKSIVAEAKAFFAGIENRYPGQRSNDEASSKIEKLFKASGAESGYTQFEMPVFIPGKAGIKVADRNIRMYAMLPNVADLGNFKQEKFSGKLFYVGSGSLKEIDNRDLRGALCLFDFDSERNYYNVMKNGAVGCLFIEPEEKDYSYYSAIKKFSTKPLTIPRYQISKADAGYLKSAAAGKEGVAYQADVQKNRWQRRTLKNHWALVEGSDPELKREMVILHANYDSMNYCPELPSGAVEAMNLKMLFDLFEKYRKDPPARSVLFQATNAFHMRHAGLREAVFHLFGSESEIFANQPSDKSEKKLNEDIIKESDYIINGYNSVARADLLKPEFIADVEKEDILRFVEGLDVNADKDSLLASLNKEQKETLILGVMQKKIEVIKESHDAPADKTVLLGEKIIKRIESDVFALTEEKSWLIRNKQLTPEVEARLDKQISKFDRVVTLFNTYGTVSKYSDLSDEQKAIFEQYRKDVVTAAENDKQRAEQHLLRLADTKKARDLFAEKKLFPLFSFDFAFDFSTNWLGIKMDGIFGSNFGSKKWVSTLLTFRNKLDIFCRALKEETGISWQSVNNDNFYYRTARVGANIQYYQQKIPAFTVASPFGSCLKTLGSADNFSAISGEAAARKFLFLDLLLDKVINNKEISDKSINLVRKNDGIYKSVIPDVNVASGQFVTREQDGSSIDEPAVICNDALIVIREPDFISQNDPFGSPLLSGGVLTYGLEISDVSGRAFFYNLPFIGKSKTFVMEAFHVDKDGQIDMAIEQGDTAKKYESNKIMELKPGYKDRHLLALFKCRKADLYDLYDPRRSKAISMPKFQKPNGGVVKWFANSGLDKYLAPYADGTGCIFLNPIDRYKVLFTSKVCLVNSVPPEKRKKTDKFPEIGFKISEMDRKSVPALCAKDVVVLNTDRIEKLKKNAVTDHLMQNLHNKSREYLDGNSGENGEKESPSLAVLKATKSHFKHFVRSLQAYGAAYGAYPVVLTTTSDMMKAVVFYLAVLIPFCFFMQKLLFTFTRIEAQIGSFAALFIFTYLVFHNVHPAFEIAKNPQIVLVAFTMIVLAGFVAFCMKGKFDYHMAAFKERFSKEEDVGVLKLAGTAMLIGVTNMKRRKLRTLLTCATIVLITFTMLSFTSVSQSVAPTRIKKAEEAPYNGIFYSRQSWGQLETNKELFLTDVVGDGQQVLRRRFVTFSTDSSNEALNVFTDDNEVPKSLVGVLGLEMSEDGWLASFKSGEEGSMLAAGRYFSSADAREIIITDEFASKSLGIKFEHGSKQVPENYWLTINGVRLKLVGIIDSKRASEVKDLRGESILPKEMAGGGRANLDKQDTKEDEMEVPEGTFKDVDAQFYVAVPFETSALFDAATMSVSIKMKDAQSVWDRVMDYVYLSNDKIYFGADEKFIVVKGEDPIYENSGSYYLGSGFETSVGGLSSLIIPLLISASIIFNTMLGSVYERNKEIAIFNAIGLNPIHIALFFVAEAVVYGILGGVGGYLIGQVLANVIVHFNILEGVNLNYSSLTVVYVILFTILIVVLSTLYPAMTAMRTASSSSGRRKPEKKDENSLEVVFPYSFTREMAVAVNSYIQEYFNLHMDSSVGSFVAAPLDCSRSSEVEDNKLVMTLKYNVALSPYDLGVTQNVIVSTIYNEAVGAFMVRAETERLSGMDTNWVATNQPFLNGIRKYLLHWRVLEEEGQQAHMENGFRMFDLEK